ncbi:MAG TPA: FAD-dependent oxidoreductase [Rhizomicrobium sp.]|nr:FAD-dependent oxidoreductase [Rhizomicrobium sp.]
MKAVICGAGISGLSLAWWLARDGWDVTLVERAPGPREEGYMIDFFGSGFDAADRMGLLPRLREVAYTVHEVVFEDGQGRPKARLSYDDFRRALKGRLLSMMRGDIERVLFAALPEQVTIRWGATIAEIRNSPRGVRVTLGDGKVLEADLLAGADGIHSQVRERIFGPARQFVRDLGFRTAAYLFDDPAIAPRLGGDFPLVSVPRRTVGLYPLRDGRIASFFVHAGRDDPRPADPARVLRDVYGSLGWCVPAALAHAGDTPIYYDMVAQVEMPNWRKDRVVLLGDACAAVSLLAGQGASMGFAMAHVLAEELRRGGDIGKALARYEKRLKGELAKKQKAGRQTASSLVPVNRRQLLMRNLALRAARLPLLRWLLMPLFLSGSESFIR